MAARMKLKDMPAEIQAKYREERKRSKPLPKVPLRGRCYKMVWITPLPIPPSVNNCYTVANGRKIKSKAAKLYQQAVCELCVRKNIGHVVGRLSVKVSVYPSSNRRFDLGNLDKILFDSLQAAGVFADDSQIDHLSFHRCAISDAPAYISVVIEGDWLVPENSGR